MDFNFSDEQSMLRDMVRGFLADNYSIDARRAAVASEAGWRAEIWREFADLGLLGAPWATHLIIPARTAGSQREPEGVSLFIVERGAPGITTKDYATIDGLRASEVYLEGVRVSGEALVGSEGAALPLIERVVDEALAAIGAEACGVMRQMHEDTVEYTRQRKQFGQPIADFQVVQHRMVDMFIQLEQAEAMTQMATLALGMDTAERSRAASAAKVQVGRACRFVAQNAVQLHGGIGVTDELALGQYFKRATILESAFGSVDHHLARYERLAYGG